MYDFKVGMLQVRENISLRKCYFGIAHLRALQGTLISNKLAYKTKSYTKRTSVGISNKLIRF